MFSDVAGAVLKHLKAFIFIGLKRYQHRKQTVLHNKLNVLFFSAEFTQSLTLVLSSYRGKIKKHQRSASAAPLSAVCLLLK